MFTKVTLEDPILKYYTLIVYPIKCIQAVFIENKYE